MQHGLNTLHTIAMGNGCAPEMPIYFVPGNHDYYASDVSTMQRQMAALQTDLLHWMPQTGRELGEKQDGQGTQNLPGARTRKSTAVSPMRLVVVLVNSNRACTGNAVDVPFGASNNVAVEWCGPLSK